MAYNYTSSPIYTVSVGGGGGGTAGQVLSVGAQGAGTSYTWANPTIATSTFASSTAAISANGTLELRGDNADLKINGESLKETLEEIKEALKIPGALNRNEALEQEFEELKQAAEHYNNLVKHFKEQKKVFEILKNQDL